MTVSDRSGIRWTIFGVLVFMAIVVASFVHRVGEPRVMSLAESRINGLFLFDTPRDVGNFSLIDHAGAPFTADRLEGHWTLLFFGFTHCPDICPTTLSDLAELKQQLQGTEADETVVVMLSVDPARDTPERLSQYVPYFHSDFLGVTGAFESILSVTQRLNAPFRKVTASDGQLPDGAQCQRGADEPQRGLSWLFSCAARHTQNAGNITIRAVSLGPLT